MPTQPSQATAEGMPKVPSDNQISILTRVLTRRGLLQSAPAVSLAVAAPIAAEAMPMSATERVEFHFAEFKRAAAEITPRIRFTRVQIDLGCDRVPVMVVAQLAQGYYAGDGVYRSSGKFTQSTLFDVRLLDYHIEGERAFSVIPHHEPNIKKWMKLTETEFEAFIGERIEGFIA